MKPMRLISGFLTVGFWTLISRIAGLVLSAEVQDEIAEAHPEHPMPY